MAKIPKPKPNPWGSLIFAISVILALVLGALGKINLTIASLLTLLGLLIGIINVTQTERTNFLLAGTSLVVISALGSGELIILPFFLEYMAGMLQGLLLLFVPATAIVAIMELWELAKN